MHLHEESEISAATSGLDRWHDLQLRPPLAPLAATPAPPPAQLAAQTQRAAPGQRGGVQPPGQQTQQTGAQETSQLESAKAAEKESVEQIVKAAIDAIKEVGSTIRDAIKREQEEITRAGSQQEKAMNANVSAINSAASAIVGKMANFAQELSALQARVSNLRVQ
jgi:hypothetical protein